MTQRIVATAELNAQIEGHPPSYVNAQASLSNVLSPRGELSFKAATANVTLLATNVPIRTEDINGQLQQLRATVVSNDLTKTIVVAIDSQAQLEGQPKSAAGRKLERG